MTTQQQQSETIAERFARLVVEWRAMRGVTSSVVEMAMQPAYQQIIGLGPDAVPLLLAELEREPDHWFWALHAITGENPVPAQARGNVKRMATAWVEWGKERGHLQ